MYNFNLCTASLSAICLLLHLLNTLYTKGGLMSSFWLTFRVLGSGVSTYHMVYFAPMGSFFEAIKRTMSAIHLDPLR